MTLLSLPFFFALAGCGGDDGQASGPQESGIYTISATASASAGEMTDSSSGSDSGSSGNSSDSEGATTGSTSSDSDVTTTGAVTTGETTSSSTTGTMKSECGNGKHEPGEQCDDGNDDEEDGCNSECELPPSTCGEVHVEAKLENFGADIIVVIDNSGSMSDDIAKVEAEFTKDFASVLEGSGVDYQVIMFTEYGDGKYAMCMKAPLSNVPQNDSCSNYSPAQASNNKFRVVDINVQSHDSLCKLNLNYALYSSYLRENAIKSFLFVTDDGVGCGSYNDQNNESGGMTAAQAFDKDLMLLDPLQFGNSEQTRNYRVYSIIGLPSNGGNLYNPNAPVALGTCPTGVDPGTGYQWLSKMTKGFRYPLCDSSYASIFQKTAEDVKKGVPIACEFNLPPEPQGEYYNLNSLLLEYYLGGDAQKATALTRVKNAAECGVNYMYYVEENPDDSYTVKLCPQLCDYVQGDPQAVIDGALGCIPEPG